RWTSQVVMPEGRPDIVLQAKDDYVLLIENKLESPLRPNQLQDYGKWLSKRSTDGALVFLTHVTPPPPNFGDERAAEFSVKWQRTSYWHQVADWFSKAGAGQRSATWTHLAKQLCDFLKENQMSEEPASFGDLDAARKFMIHNDRVQVTFARIAAAVDRLPFVVKQRRKTEKEKLYGPAVYDSEGSCIQDWRELKPNWSGPDGQWFVGWGIRFPSR